MKKLAILFFALAVLLGGSILGPSLAIAEDGWDDCPRGEVDCEYPGLCNRYIDTNNDGICDHSQPAPEQTAIEPVEYDTVDFPLLASLGNEVPPRETLDENTPVIEEEDSPEKDIIPVAIITDDATPPTATGNAAKGKLSYYL